MYVIVYCNEGPDQGYVHLTRALADDEFLNERACADEVANHLGTRIAAPDGYILNCCGDIRVEFIDHEPSIIDERYQGSVCIWSGQSFYFEAE